MKKKAAFFVLFFCICIYVNAQSHLWKDIACGGKHVIALMQDSTIRSWGYNGYGQSGTGNDIAMGIPGLSGHDHDWIMIDAGYMHSLAMKADSTIWGWGLNMQGQAGQEELGSIMQASQIGTDNDWKTIEAGNYSGHAIKRDGSLWSWGINGYGILGIGSSNVDSLRNSPVRIGLDNDWVDIFVGEFIAYAIKTDGSLWAWGYNYSGQIPGAVAGMVTAPVLVDDSSDWRIISCGDYHICGIKTDSTLWTWGSSEFGALGNGVLGASQQNTPFNILPEEKWIDVHAGYFHTLAIRDDSKVFGWGKNELGALGQGHTNNVAEPEMLDTQTGWKILAGSMDFSIINAEDNEYFYAAGINTSHQLGHCTLTDFESEFIHSSVRDTIIITTQPENTSYCLGEHIFLLTTSDQTWYKQWQVSINEGVDWQDIVDDGIHLSPTENNLQIPMAAENVDGNYYRCILSTPCLPNDTTDAVTIDLILIDNSIQTEGNTLTVVDTEASVTWLDCDTQTFVSGEIADSFIPEVAGNYAAVLTKGHCVDTSDCIYINPVFISQETFDEFNVFYDSHNSMIIVKCPAKSVFSIYDICGEEIFTQFEIDQNFKFRTYDLISGIYLVRVTNGKQSITQKIFIE